MQFLIEPITPFEALASVIVVGLVLFLLFKDAGRD